MTYDIIKKNYDRKLWNNKMIAVAVDKGVITEEQYKEITGEDYPVTEETEQETTDESAEN